MFPRVLLLLSGFILTFCVGSVSSLFFLLADGEQRCFSQHMAEETPLIGDYRTDVYEEQDEDQVPVQVEFSGPDGQLLLSQFGSEGTFRFTSQEPGGYEVCVQTLERPLSAGRTLAVHLDVRLGERTNNYSDVQRRHKLTMLRLTIIRLTEEARHVLREQHYLKFRLRRFQELNLSINMWMFWWPVVRALYVVTFIIIITGSW